MEGRGILNILILGNGFDLAHNLPTKYEDFLDFTYTFKSYYDEKDKGQYEFQEKCQRYKEYILALFNEAIIDERANELLREMTELINGNRWLEHFWKIKQAGNWVDFEREISKIIQALDRARKSREDQMKNSPEIESFSLEKRDANILKSILLKGQKMTIGGIEQAKDWLLSDLNKLIRCLEIYLNDYVEQIIPHVKLPDIEHLDVHCVLSFNYTHTYESFYDTGKKIYYDYIHGEVKRNSNIETCNLILGIDEYLEGDFKRKDNEYIQFKKFYQRIYKKTGCRYVDWQKRMDQISNAYKKKNEFPIHNIYIFGHSLDITDGDILSGLINSDMTKVTIFHHSKEELGHQICNLVKILGEDELIAMVHGANAKIILQEQKGTIQRKV